MRSITLRIEDKNNKLTDLNKTKKGNFKIFTVNVNCEI